MRVLIPILVFATLAGPLPELRAQTQPLPDVGRVPRPPRVQVDPDFERAELIVLRFKKHDIMNPTPMTRAQLERVIQAAGVPLRFERVGGGDMQVLRLPRKMRDADAEGIAQRIARLPEVEFADFDRAFGLYAPRSEPEEPNDPEQKTRQRSFWNLKSSVAGANVEPARDVTTGAPSTAHTLRELLMKSARAFVGGTDLDCTTPLCGARVAHVEAAPRAAAR